LFTPKIYGPIIPILVRNKKCVWTVHFLIPIRLCWTDIPWSRSEVQYSNSTQKVSPHTHTTHTPHMYHTHTHTHTTHTHHVSHIHTTHHTHHTQSFFLGGDEDRRSFFIFIKGNFFTCRGPSSLFYSI
jgi:hypothetical protein